MNIGKTLPAQRVLLGQLVLVFATLNGNSVFLDERVLFPLVALARDFNKRGIDHPSRAT